MWITVWGLTSVWHEVKATSVFFFLCRPSQRENPPCLFDSPALPLLSTLYLAILDAACYYMLSIYVKVVSKSKISIMMEEEANARLAFHLISLKNVILGWYASLQLSRKRVFPKAACLSDFSGIIVVWAAVWGGTFILASSPPRLPLLSSFLPNLPAEKHKRTL